MIISYSKSMCLFMGSGFLVSYRGLRKPRNFYRLSLLGTMSDHNWRVFHSRGIYPFFLILDTYFLYHFNQSRDSIRHCPIYQAHSINTKYNVDLPTMHSHPTQYVALVHIQCKMPLHVISCYMYNAHYMEQFINRTICQVPLIIISKAYNLHLFMLIHITPIHQHIYKTFSML